MNLKIKKSYAIIASLQLCMMLFSGNLNAQALCAQAGWCTHTVYVTNYSKCTVDIWCDEFGCGPNTFMGTLQPGQSLTGLPSSYQAIFRVAYNGNYVHTFGQLQADGHCYTYNFDYNPGQSPCQPACSPPSYNYTLLRFCRR